ncbi:Integrase core domain [Popillia japonica]|uniref:Integrase core domain n=1 Tax=Popillia japonica TaxID=7064 RepID=A0AAW1K0B5_POPJA
MELIQRTYWFPKLKDKVKIYISNCLKCISYSPVSGKQEEYLNIVPKGDLPFSTLHIDHYGPLDKTRYNHKHILLVVDGFTKFVRIYVCSSTNTNQVIRHLRNYFHTYSKPIQIVSDRGSCFTSKEFKDFIEANGIRHSLIATGTPRANGQAEIVNKMLTNICSKLAANTSKWDEVLDQVEFANNTLNRSTGQTPSMLLFGINQRGRIQDNLREYIEAQNETDRNLESIRQKSAENIVKNQEYNKPSHIYKIGDYVMVVNTDVTPGVSKKLIPKYRGPYMVTAVLDNDRYVVKDIPGFEVTQIPFEGIMAPSRMRPWFRTAETVVNKLIDSTKPYFKFPFAD